MYVRLKHVNRVSAKGRTYYYHRITGERLPDDLDIRAARVLEINKGIGKRSEPKYGSMAALITQYKQSPGFQTLADKTRREYARYFSYFENHFGDLPVADLTREFVLELRDTLSYHPSKADHTVKALRLLLTFAIDRPRRYGLMHNPASRTPHIAKAEGYKPWPDNLISAFRNEARPELVWCMEVGLYTGQRGQDCRAMLWTHRKDGGIEVAQQKTGTRLWLPEHPKLTSVLDSIPRRAAVVLTTYTGRAWSDNNFITQFRKATLDCGFEGYSFHGLRKNAAKTLAEAGCTDRQIMAITGHKTTEMVSLYTRDVEQRDLAREAMAKWEQRGNKTAKPPAKTAKLKNSD